MSLLPTEFQENRSSLSGARVKDQILKQELLQDPVIQAEGVRSSVSEDGTDTRGTFPMIPRHHGGLLLSDK